MLFKQFYLPCLAHASYIIGDEAGGTATVVDPQRDTDQYAAFAAQHARKIPHVFLTHLHADFVAGHLELCDRAGATIYLGAAAKAVATGPPSPQACCKVVDLIPSVKLPAASQRGRQQSCPLSVRATPCKSVSNSLIQELEPSYSFAKHINYDSETSFEPAVAVEELLRGSKRRLVQFLGALHQAEAPTKLAVERSRVIAHYLEPGTLRRAFWSKRADDNVATWPDSASNLPNVGDTSRRGGQEMEYCSIMPEVVGTRFQLDFQNIAL
jgi:hypothetical protein